jgi:hypothetical protein
MWSSIGYGTAALISGSTISISKNTNKMNYLPTIIMMVTCFVMDMIVCVKLEVLFWSLRQNELILKIISATCDGPPCKHFQRLQRNIKKTKHSHLSCICRSTRSFQHVIEFFPFLVLLKKPL